MRGQVWWATIDGSSRPWLVVQAEALNETAPTVVALRLTLAEQEAGFPLTVCLDPSETGLPKPVWIRVTEVRSLRRDELEEPIVTLGEERMDEVAAALAKVLDISGPPEPVGYRTRRTRTVAVPASAETGVGGGGR
jgi:mRNA-degrading endonuclease toxin of MazEF toxin-antitoxin module